MKGNKSNFLLLYPAFSIFYCYDGLFRERPFEILAYVAAVVVIIVYTIINFIANGDEGQPFRIVSRGSILLCLAARSSMCRCP